jgi:hypothetical protein
MPLIGFQRALADFAASPARCAEAMEAPATILAPYGLTELEQTRLIEMVRDPLMATNCALYRANRITPIFMFFPMTCRLLGEKLRSVIDAFWCTNSIVDLQYASETARFAGFLRSRLQMGLIRSSYLDEILAYEASAIELRFNGTVESGSARLVYFSHDPSVLLSVLGSSKPVPEDLPVHPFLVWMFVEGNALVVRAEDVSHVAAYGRTGTNDSTAPRND